MTSNSAGPPASDGHAPWGRHQPPAPAGAPRPPVPAPAQQHDPHGRRRLFWSLGAGATVLALVGTTALVVFSRGEDPPEDLTSLYATDFATNPGWSTGLHDRDEEPYASGYLPGEGQMMAYDPSGKSDPWSGAVLSTPMPEDGDLPPHLMVEADVRVVEGYEYLSFGVECTDEYFPPGSDPLSPSEEKDHFVTYRLSVRADGEQAVLTRNTPGTDGREELASGPVPDFDPYPAVDGGGREEGTDPVSNNVKLSCESEAPDGDRPGRTTVTAWVNDHPVAQAVDDEAAPAGHDGHELVRKQRIAYDRGQGEVPLRVLFEDYHLYEVGG
ncbi:hypothetical protein [Nocardiopsis xinjiangensis]|uniref:hypothetical protein n=1 Tax=Nocardiopsis xinjiangensis TaxID=124285 RepID=UPI00034C4F4D|nr:hypothetical protein [Nocardiopsis xinjiangensis]